jgi:O-methyltransferase
MNQPYMEMMNDTLRNQFYDKILKEVRGKRCLEIGFGAGLLSLTALKYQPKHIVAVEQQLEVYELGKYLIKKLGLTNQITLLHKQVDSSFIDPAEFDVVYHEVVGGGMWHENLFFNLDTDVPFIPSTYTCDFYACKISSEEFEDVINCHLPISNNKQFRSWYQNIKDPSWPTVQHLKNFDLLPDHIKAECVNQFQFVKEKFQFPRIQQKFIPGVDISTDYVNEIQNLLTLENSISYTEIIPENSLNDEDYYLSQGTRILTMEIDQHSNNITVIDQNGTTTSTGIDFTNKFFDLTIDRSALHGTTIIIPVYSLKHKESKLILSQGHWKHPGNNAIVKPGVRNITVRQHFNTNGIEYF